MCRAWKDGMTPLTASRIKKGNATTCHFDSAADAAGRPCADKNAHPNCILQRSVNLRHCIRCCCPSYQILYHPVWRDSCHCQLHRSSRCVMELTVVTSDPHFSSQERCFCIQLRLSCAGQTSPTLVLQASPSQYLQHLKVSACRITVWSLLGHRI